MPNPLGGCPKQYECDIFERVVDISGALAAVLLTHRFLSYQNHILSTYLYIIDHSSGLCSANSANSAIHMDLRRGVKVVGALNSIHLYYFGTLRVKAISSGLRPWSISFKYFTRTHRSISVIHIICHYICLIYWLPRRFELFNLFMPVVVKNVLQVLTKLTLKIKKNKNKIKWK